jgi:hypothetical protein
MSHKFGRLPREFDPRIPHLSALFAGKPRPRPPQSRHWGSRMPADLGVMLNDKLLNCTCAAFYHALQVWSFNVAGKLAAKMVTGSDTNVTQLYTLACGYDPKRPGEGPGGKGQHVLRYLLNHGAPVGQRRRNKILAYIEIDPRQIDDVRRAINDCGLVYVGFNAPQYLGPQNRHLPKVWDVDPADRKIIGGHAVVLPGYDEETVDVISWGRFYKMTWRFFSKYVEEVYAIADPAWIAAIGKTPGGLSPKELEIQMQALREVGAKRKPEPQMNAD